MMMVFYVLAAHVPLFVHAATLTNDKIKQSEESKKQAEEEKKALKNNLTDVKSLLADLETSKNDLENYIQELDGQLDAINKKIDDLNRLITDKEFEIQTTETELEEAKHIADTQYETMKKRIKFVYEHGESSKIEMLLSSKSFVDFLNKAEFITRMSAYDKRMLDSFIDSKNMVAAKEEELLAQKESLE
ncbi:MAG: peptidase M23, partial [Lachnospiraceae bacterium]|nr:peptidase M23 [Lachnospiraceae bacterium]